MRLFKNENSLLRIYSIVIALTLLLGVILMSYWLHWLYLPYSDTFFWLQLLIPVFYISVFAVFIFGFPIYHWATHRQHVKRLPASCRELLLYAILPIFLAPLYLIACVVLIYIVPYSLLSIVIILISELAICVALSLQITQIVDERRESKTISEKMPQYKVILALLMLLEILLYLAIPPISIFIAVISAI